MGGNKVVTFVKAFLAVVVLWISTGAASDPCDEAVKAPNLDERRSDHVIGLEDVEICDIEIDPGRWYDLGGNMTTHCMVQNSCGTTIGIWMDADHPTGDEIVKVKACAGISRESCCSWKSEIEVKRCPSSSSSSSSPSFVYKLKAEVICPMAYCVGENSGGLPVCARGSVLLKRKQTCLGMPSLSRPVMSGPYVSATKKVTSGNDVYNATQFSVDCFPDYSAAAAAAAAGKQLPGKLLAEVQFRMNDVDVIANFSGNSSKLTITDSLLNGHLGKTLTCAVRYYYVTKEGLVSEPTDWLKSDGYFFGVLAYDKSGTVVKEVTTVQGQPHEVTYRATFPIPLGHCFGKDRCHPLDYEFPVLQTTKKLKTSACHVTLGVDRQEVTLRFSVRTTFGAETSEDRVAFGAYSREGTLFHGYTLPPIKVIIKDRFQRKSCRSTGDPHFSSFGATSFDNYDTGDFNLLSQDEGVPFEIQVRHLPCGNGRVTCTCGVIAREGNNVIGISSCDELPNPLAFQLMADDVNPRPIVHRQGSTYNIQFASEVAMTVVTWGRFINVHVYARKEQIYAGICASSSGDFSAHRVPAEKSFFHGNLPACSASVNESPGCACCPDGGSGDLLLYPNVCNLRDYLEQRSPELKVVQSFAEPDPSKGILIEDIFASVKRSIEREERVVKVITDAEAREMCDRVFRESQFYEACVESINEDLQNINTNCIDDVKMSGDEAFGRVYLLVFERVCRENVERRIEITDSTQGEKHLLDLVASMEGGSCPLCHNGGRCASARCLCVDDYTGQNCQYKRNAKPEIAFFQAQQQQQQQQQNCDRSVRACHLVNLHFRNVPQSPDVAVEAIFEFYTQDGQLLNVSRGFVELSELGLLHTSLVEGHFQAIIRSRSVVRRRIRVAATNRTQVLESNLLNSVVYDGVCMSCLFDNCTQKADSCHIEGRCYKPNEALNDKEHCDPSVSRTNWTIINEHRIPWLAIVICLIIVIVIVSIIVFVVRSIPGRSLSATLSSGGDPTEDN